MKKHWGNINMQRGQKVLGEIHVPRLPAEKKLCGLQGLVVLLMAVLFLVSVGASLQARQSQAIADRSLSTIGR